MLAFLAVRLAVLIAQYMTDLLPPLKPIAIKERLSILFIEKGHLDVLDGAFVVVDKSGVRTHIPVGGVACLMLEPGTRTSHAAVALAARVGPHQVQRLPPGAARSSDGGAQVDPPAVPVGFGAHGPPGRPPGEAALQPRSDDAQVGFVEGVERLLRAGHDPAGEDLGCHLGDFRLLRLQED